MIVCTEAICSLDDSFFAPTAARKTQAEKVKGLFPQPGWCHPERFFELDAHVRLAREGTVALTLPFDHDHAF